ncbi:MAG: hypothetical protein MUC83_15975 [Pirellula sp.]|jgi:hypothetical protein|nr:hypothetical protein [Pirellula sp.]
MTDQQSMSPPRGIPGKWFALPFGMVLLFAVWLVVSMAFRFQAIMRQLEETRAVWPGAAVVIRTHVRDASQAFASGVESNISNTKAWDDCIARFSKSSIFDEQSIAAREMFEMAKPIAGEKTALEKVFADESFRSVCESERKRSQLQSGIVGWCTLKGLRLKLPPLFVMD